MTTSDDQPLLHIDDDWKAQAQAEKAKLAQQQKAKAASTGAPGGAPAGDAKDSTGQPAAGASATGRQIPPASMQTLVSTIASQALYAMGAMPDPQTGQRYSDLAIARHHIDTLSVLQEKTKDNLTDDEAKLLSGTLYELRASYVQVANASRSPATGGQSA